MEGPALRPSTLISPAIVQSASSSSSVISQVPATSRFLVLGREPMLSYCTIDDGSKALGAMVSGVFNLAKSFMDASVPKSIREAPLHLTNSFLFSPLLLSPRQEPPTTNANPHLLQPFTVVHPISSFNDASRQMVKCQVTADANFCAISDSLGRVWLFDCNENVFVRLFKGYRDARCGWIRNVGDPVGGEEAPLHLVIFSSNRRSVEVFDVKHGGLVGASTHLTSSNASRALICVTNGVMGASHSETLSKSNSLSENVYVVGADGNVYQWLPSPQQ